MRFGLGSDSVMLWANWTKSGPTSYSLQLFGWIRSLSFLNKILELYFASQEIYIHTSYIFSTFSLSFTWCKHTMCNLLLLHSMFLQFQKSNKVDLKINHLTSNLFYQERPWRWYVISLPFRSVLFVTRFICLSSCLFRRGVMRAQKEKKKRSLE